MDDVQEDDLICWLLEQMNFNATKLNQLTNERSNICNVYISELQTLQTRKCFILKLYGKNVLLDFVFKYKFC